MKLFTLALMTFISVFGVIMGFRLITGRDLVTLRMPALGGAEARTNPAAKPVALPTSPPPTLTPQADSGGRLGPGWVRTHSQTELWSGPDEAAISFGPVPEFSYFQVVRDQEGTRLYVLNPLTQNYAYIDAAAVSPTDAPPQSYRSTPEPAKPEGAMRVGNTDGLGVYVRRTPRMGDRLRPWADGTPMEVLEQGIQSEGRMWTKVRAPDGVEGYVPEQYLVPAR